MCHLNGLKKEWDTQLYRMLEEVYASWTKISRTEKIKIREWISERSQHGQTPEMEKYFLSKSVCYWANNGGEGGIRTLDRDKPIHAFQACAFGRSATSPCSQKALIRLF